MEFEDSTSNKISEILPRSGKRLLFEYEYDFGDGWQHEVLFEGCVQAERGKRYPVCLRAHAIARPKTWVALEATRSSWRP